MKDKEDGIYLFRHILHRAQFASNVSLYDSIFKGLFLSDLLYLSMFLENYVLQSNLTVRDFPQLSVETPLEIDFFEQAIVSKPDASGKRKVTGFNQVIIEHEDDLFDDYHLDRFVLDTDSMLEKRIKENPILKGLENNEYFKIIQPNVRVDFEKIYDLGLLIQDDSYDFDAYMALSLSEVLFANNQDLSIVPDNSASTKSALKATKTKTIKVTNEAKKIYGLLAKKAKEDLVKLMNAGNKKKIPLPPITSIIFNEARSLDEMLAIANQLRTQFAKLRTAFRDYEASVKDDSLSLKQSLDAINELEYIANRVCTNYQKKSFAEISEWRDLSNLSRVIDGISATDAGSLTGMLLNKPLKHFAEKIRNRKINYIFELEKQFYSIKNYGQMVKRLFGKDIEEEDIKNAMKNGFDLKDIIK